MNNIIISPSILSADFVNLEKDIKRVEKTDAKLIFKCTDKRRFCS